MSKNLCPENNITFENSQTIRFETPIPAGTYTASAIVESTDTDNSVCLMLFYYADNSTLEVYISRSANSERVSKTFTLAQDATKVRIYASEGYNPSVGDTATFTQLQIEAGDQMTEYVPYGEEEITPEPDPDIPEFPEFLSEVVWYYMLWSGQPVEVNPPACRHTMLIKKILDPSYELPFGVSDRSSDSERYLFDIANGTTEMLSNNPKTDMERYLHLMIGGTVDHVPDKYSSILMYWMNEVYEKKYKVVTV